MKCQLVELATYHAVIQLYMIEWHFFKRIISKQFQSNLRPVSTSMKEKVKSRATNMVGRIEME